MAHNDERVAVVGRLIRRVNVREAVGDVAAALVKALAANGDVIRERVDFQNDRLVLFRQFGENQRTQTVAAHGRLDAEMLHIDIRAEIPVEDQTGQRAIQQAEIEVIQRIVHHGLLIRPETQFMRGKAPAVQRHGGVHQRAARVTAADKGQSHQKTS